MKNKIILNIVLVYFIVVSIVLILQLYSGSEDKDLPVTETVRLVDKLDNAVVVCTDSPVMLVNKRQVLCKNYSVTPIKHMDSFYVPLSFFETAYNAAVEEDFDKKQATLRMDNTAVVFNAVDAKVISNSTEKDISLDAPVIYRNTYAYIPVSAFCKIFNKEAFEYDNKMLIISSASEKVDFDPAAEADMLADIEQQVSNLPLVMSENNLRALIGAKPAIFGIGDEQSVTQTSAAKAEKMVIGSSQSDKIAISGEYVYAVCNGKLLVSDGSTVTEVQLPQNFTPETITAYDSKLFIAGMGNNAILPVTEMTFGTEEEGESRTQSAVTARGEKFCLLCCETEDKLAPKIVRWFYADGKMSQKQLFENSLCIELRKNVSELYDGESYKTPEYCDFNKKTSYKFDEIKYLPQMLDRTYTAVYRFDMADLSKSADADVFLGVGEDITLGQNSVVFSAQASLPSENGVVTNKLTELYKINLSSGAFSHDTLDGTLISLNRVKDYGGYTALAEKSGKSILYTLNDSLKTDNRLDLSVEGLVNASCESGNVYLADASKNNMVIASLSQVYEEEENSEEPRTVITAQEKGVIALDGVEYIRPYETTAVGLGKNRELDNAEISMWALKDSAVRTAADSIGAAGSSISPVETKNIADGEMVFDLSLYVAENDVSEEKYNGLYIYTTSENNTPVFKGRITHNDEGSVGIKITDAAYLNGRYFTLSDSRFAVNADDADMTSVYMYK